MEICPLFFSYPGIFKGHNYKKPGEGDLESRIIRQRLKDG